MIGKVIFWLSAALIFYAFFGYPLVLLFLQIPFRRRIRKEKIEPSVSILVAAYNEASVIAAKVRNALALDYPPDRLEIVIASDGSTDETAQIVESLILKEGQDRVRLLNYPENRGKVTVLNESVPQLRGEIVVFSDASSMLAKDALRQLIANFAEDRVGAASGVYQVLRTDDAKLGRQEDLYWKYETFLKVREANIGALAGAHGSLYAMRKSLYPFPPVGTINDDFVIPTSVLHRGYRIAYEPLAVAYEEAHEMEGFGRRIRITAGNVEQLFHIKNLLWPPQPLVLFCFLSHKGARLVVPLAMIALLASNSSLWRLPFYHWVLWGQIIFYGFALIGALGQLRPRVLRLPFYFCMINASLFVWLYYRISKRNKPSSSDGKPRNVAWT
ncbi:MAG TPA: glycosyltransferase family 2 protein [Candidatus Acidoferrum sp.]|nr:glycosyltransferase family 2 protein [Candidatus Acidoferrum sp.]